MEFLRCFWEAAAAVDPAARALDEGERFALCRCDALTRLLRAGGLREVRCEPLEISTEFAGFDDYWRPLLGAPAPHPPAWHRSILIGARRWRDRSSGLSRAGRMHRSHSLRAPGP